MTLLALLAAADVPAGPGPAPSVDGAPAVRLVRPLPTPGPALGGPFSAAAGDHVFDDTEHDIGEPFPLGASHVARGASSIVTLAGGPRVWPAAMAAAPWATPAPVVFAAPSWTFAAAPATPSFVSARGGFPPAAR